MERPIIKLRVMLVSIDIGDFNMEQLLNEYEAFVSTAGTKAGLSMLRELIFPHRGDR